MRENTFDIPAVQFYVSNGMTDCTSELYPRAKGELGNDPTKIAVPFEAVDGLVVKEVLDYLENYSLIRSGISISALSVSDSLKGDKVYIPLLFEKINIQMTLVQKAIFNGYKNKYIFIIDEINRGEISKIFGELFFSIDPGYRGERGLVKTQYQNLITDESDPFYEGFYVPENVYLIGTMNDIDRSVESMDFAMRRRFAWIEVKADENTEMLDEKLSDMKDEIVSIMKRLNAAIWDEDNNTGIEGLSAAYHIGGSYFSKLSLYLNKEHTNKQEAYEILWNNHLKGILFEYLRGTINAIQNLKMLEQVYFNYDVNYDTE